MNSKVLFCLCAFSLFPFITATCPTGTVASLTDPTICYLFISTKQAYLNAEESCVQNNGHLVSIHNMLENVFIAEQSQLYFTDSASSDFWIGVTDLATPATWGWMDNSALSFVDWDQKQPQAGYDCGAARLQGGKWISDDCYKEKPFVCLVKPVPATTPPPRKCPDQWNFFDKTNACYKVFTNATWDIAEDTCYSKGAHLTSIHSSDENHFITNLIPFDPNNYECNEGQFARIGLFRVSNITNWRWTDNTAYNYAAWAPSHPNAMTTAVLWNGPPCNAPSETWANGYPELLYKFFICKKPAL